MSTIDGLTFAAMSDVLSEPDGEPLDGGGEGSAGTVEDPPPEVEPVEAVPAVVEDRALPERATELPMP
jgi:hypothetical protein